VNKKINQLVWDKSDRILVKIAHNSDSKTLVSHNKKHLYPPRGELGRRYGIVITGAPECRAALA
jgi:hypothetical protein